MKDMLVVAACVVLLGTAACSVTTGVSFPNARLGSGSTMQINGLLAKPEGNGPFPAVVLLHTCGGVEDHTKWVWPDALRQKGYVTLTVDSFGSRGLGKCPNALVSGGSALLDLSADAFGGLDYLASLPFVDKERIGVVGFSLGGRVIKDGILAYALVRPQGASRFKAAVSLYGSCGSYFRGFNGSYPFHLLEIAGENDINILKECRTVKNPEFEMRVLPGAYHAWDQADATTIRPDVAGNPRLYDYRATKESEKIVLEFLAKNLP
jgi:dienelactone hydrolase